MPSISRDYAAFSIMDDAAAAAAATPKFTSLLLWPTESVKFA
jgi:hypothetical protein